MCLNQKTSLPTLNTIASPTVLPLRCSLLPSQVVGHNVWYQEVVIVPDVRFWSLWPGNFLGICIANLWVYTIIMSDCGVSIYSSIALCSLAGMINSMPPVPILIMSRTLFMSYFSLRFNHLFSTTSVTTMFFFLSKLSLKSNKSC